MKRCRQGHVWLAAVLFLYSVLPAVAGQAPDFSAVEKAAIDELRQLNTPGAAIGIVSGNRLVYEKGVGISDFDNGMPMAPEMLFRLGSTTKMFTALALVSLAEEGKIKLDEPIGRSVGGLDPKIAAITAHQLLTHTSGLFDEAPMYGSQDESALAATVRSWKGERFFTTPGDVYSYSNPGYWFAGFIVESLSGKPYADAMNERVFAPLGMSRTTLRPTMAMTYPLAQGHDLRAGKPVVVRPAANNAASWPAGSIFSNVHDLSRFVIAFVNGGKLDGRLPISANVIARLSSPYVEIPGSRGAHYGYGLEIREERGVRTLKHGGSRSGYGSLIWMVPDYRFGVIILANRTGASLSRTAAKAMEIMLPLKPAPPEAAETDLPITAEDKGDLPGIYTHPPSQRVEIVRKGDNLFVRRGGADLPVRKIAVDRISAAQAGSARGQQYVIVRGKDGRTLYLHSGGRALKKN